MSSIDQNRFFPQPNVYAEESDKTCTIKDPIGNIRYKVVLSSYQESIDETNYRVKVLNCFYDQENPLVIVDKPSSTDPKPTIDSYAEAIGIYDDYVRSYTNLVKAETRDFQGIEVYSDKISYSLEKPKCCSTCYWSKRNRSPQNDFEFGATGKLECWNPKCCAEYGFDPQAAQQIDPRGIHFIGEPVRPSIEEVQQKLLLLHPIVDPFGLCKHYEEKEIHYEPIYGDSLGHIVDNRMVKIAPAVISAQVSASTMSVLLSALPTVIGPAIEYQLSTHFPILDGNRSNQDNENQSEEYSDNEENSDNSIIITSE